MDAELREEKKTKKQATAVAKVMTDEEAMQEIEKLASSEPVGRALQRVVFTETKRNPRRTGNVLHGSDINVESMTFFPTHIEVKFKKSWLGGSLWGFSLQSVTEWEFKA